MQLQFLHPQAEQTYVARRDRVGGGVGAHAELPRLEDGRGRRRRHGLRPGEGDAAAAEDAPAAAAEDILEI